MSELGFTFDTKYRDVGDGEWVLRMLRRGVKMASLPLFTSVFALTGTNMSVGPNARREALELRRSAPVWVRGMRPAVIAQHRLRRWLGGMYRQDPFAVNDFGENAAFIAAKHGKVDVIEYLWHTTGVDVTRRNRDGLTILDAIKGKKWEEEAKTVICAIQKAIFAKRKPILAARLQLIRLKLH